MLSLRSIILATAACATVAAQADTITFNLDSYRDLTSVTAFASYTDLYNGQKWAKIGTLASVSANVPTLFTATTDGLHHSDGRFALMSVYGDGTAPSPYGVNVALSDTNYNYLLGKGWSSLQPHVTEDQQVAYLQGFNGGFSAYVLNDADQSGIVNRFPVASGDSKLMNFSNGTDGGTLHVTVVPAVVPEPSTVAAFGLGALALVRRRRK